MKQTFYVHQYSDGQLCFYSENKSIILPQIGTITLDVEPIKKEVEKVIERPDMSIFAESMSVWTSLPKGAYDVKVVYKIKE